MFGIEPKHQEDQRLLQDTKASPYAENTSNVLVYNPKNKISQWMLISLFINAVLVAWSIYLLARQEPNSQSPFPQHIYSPAHEALAYKTVIFHSNAENDTTIYQGPPSKEVDAAWEDLYRNVGISQIDKESASKLPNATAPLGASSDQHIVALDVFHQLHCLNMIRKSLFPEYYGGHPLAVNTSHGVLNETAEGNEWHLAHCVDSIRQSLMCSVDISTIFWHWIPELQRSAPSAQTTHTCRDFDAVRKWAEKHVLVEEFDDKNPF